MKNESLNLHTKKRGWKRTIIECILIGCITIFFFKNIVLWGIVPSESMQPTLNVSDVVLASGIAYINKEPQRGDIVVFTGKDTYEDEFLIKRIIGLPGDSLMFVDGDIYINGQLCVEEYLKDDIETNSFKDYEVPKGSYFVLGDNRSQSYDSRYWSEPYISKEDIKGKLILVIPFSKMSIND